MDLGKRSGSKGTVIRGDFNPRHEPSTIRRRNKNATGLPERSPFCSQFGTPEGHVFRATEILRSLSRKKRGDIARRLTEMMARGQTVEEIAWEFVTTAPENRPLKFSLDDAARAEAFMIIAYGSESLN